VKGQWIGVYTGSAYGKLIVNIDVVEDHYEGVAYINPSDQNQPYSIAYIKTLNKDNEQETIATVHPVDPRTGFQGEWDQIKNIYKDFPDHSKEAKINISLNDGILKINAETDIGVILSSSLTKPEAIGDSKITARKMNWGDFKDRISTISKDKYLFRGQQKPWRLSTSFHRRERYRISEFITKDVPQLHQRLSAITPHYFDLESPKENGAFFNLLQHHGYPTPLLDWTRSPYVAAFFAFRDWQINYQGNEYIRIYIFNDQEWQTTFPQIQSIDPAFLHLSVTEFIAINNPRTVPQQSVTTVTNIDDIESYIIEKGAQSNPPTEFIEAIEIPANQREAVMDDLRFMGITAASMFPSIDGVCEEYRERNFEK